MYFQNYFKKPSFEAVKMVIEICQFCFIWKIKKTIKDHVKSSQNTQTIPAKGNIFIKLLASTL